MGTFLSLRSIQAATITLCAWSVIGCANSHPTTAPSGMTDSAGDTNPDSAQPGTTQPARNAPKYPVAYRAPTAVEITAVLDRVHARLDAIPARIIDRQTKKEVTDLSKPVFNLRADSGPEDKFNPVSYPMGVIHNGMLNAAEVTGDQRFSHFTAKWLQLFADKLPALSTWPSRTLENPNTQPATTQDESNAAPPAPITNAARNAGRRAGGGAGGPPRIDNPLRPLLAPDSLDACGAMTTGMIKARLAGIGPDLKEVIDRAVDYVHRKQFRLPDGTLARHNPVPESIWADDMYMGVCILAQAGKMTGDTAYFDDAAKQVLQISQHLWVPEQRLLTHGWNSVNPDFHPKYFWGRANGWCMMAMAELLTALPENHPDRAAVLKQFRSLAEGVASVQGGDGLWHQMLDRTDSYTETSCSAMFTFAIARGVDRGWLDFGSYGPVAQAGWNGVAPRVDKDGRIFGTCVGTSYANDYTYYYYRPAIDDVHAYGPVLLAGSEMLKLQKNTRFRTGNGNGNGNVTFAPANRRRGGPGSRPANGTTRPTTMPTTAPSR